MKALIGRRAQPNVDLDCFGPPEVLEKYEEIIKLQKGQK